MGMSVYVLLTTLELIVTSNRVAVTVANAPLVHSASIPQMDTNVSAQMDTKDNSVRPKSMYVKKDKRKQYGNTSDCKDVCVRIEEYYDKFSK